MAPSGAQVMDMRLQLQTFKKGYQNIEDYVLRIKIISYHLATISQLVPNHDLVFYVLGGLDAKWNSFIFGITLKPNPIRFNDVYNNLLSHRKILERQSFSSGFMQANVAMFGSGSSSLHNQGNITLLVYSFLRSILVLFSN